MEHIRCTAAVRLAARIHGEIGNSLPFPHGTDCCREEEHAESPAAGQEGGVSSHAPVAPNLRVFVCVSDRQQ